jgi:aldose 1-epimerase
MSELFGHLSDGRPVNVFTLTNRSGTEVRLITLGAAIISCRTRDRNGVLADVALGFTDLASYVDHPAYFGALVGRYANRISNARFSIDGRTYTLAPNDGLHHLHGRGFDKHVWNADALPHEEHRAVTFFRVSPSRVYPRRAGLRLETQHFPDSPNHPQFPCTILRPGTELTSRTVFRFGIRP